MLYQIEVEYETGSSFHNEITTDIVELGWDNIDMAKKSLKRIHDHYLFYRKHSNEYSKPKETPPNGTKWSNKQRELILELVKDNGKSYKYYPFWIGYFERLISAKVIEKEDKGMSFTI